MKNKKLSNYIKSKLAWAYQFSRGENAIYNGKSGRYIMDKNNQVYFYPYDGSCRLYLGEYSPK